MLKPLTALEKYDPKNPDKIKSRKETLITAEELYNNRDNVIEAFENWVFPFKYGFYQKEWSDVSDKVLPDCIKVDKKRVDRINNETVKMLKINLLYQEGVVILLMLTIHTNWFKT